MTGYLDAHSQPTCKAAQGCFINYNKSSISDLFVPLHLAGTRELHILAQLLIPGAHCMHRQLSEIAFLNVQVL